MTTGRQPVSAACVYIRGLLGAAGNLAIPTVARLPLRGFHLAERHSVFIASDGDHWKQTAQCQSVPSDRRYQQTSFAPLAARLYQSLPPPSYETKDDTAHARTVLAARRVRNMCYEVHARVPESQAYTSCRIN